jgi:hypothetical protein
MKLMSFVLSTLISSLCIRGFAQAPVADVSLQTLEREIARLASSAGGEAAVKWNADPRDISTPDAMVERERAIAQIARTVYDFFLFLQPAAQRDTQ